MPVSSWAAVDSGSTRACRRPRTAKHMPYQGLGNVRLILLQSQGQDAAGSCDLKAQLAATEQFCRSQCCPKGQAREDLIAASPDQAFYLLTLTVQGSMFEYNSTSCRANPGSS